MQHGPASPRGAEITCGRARFSAITSDCVRLEYALDGVFVDEPSLLAVRRDLIPFSAARPHAEGVELQTERLRLSFRDDGRPFHAGNLEIELRGADRSILWRPGQVDAGNLGGPLSTLDGILGPEPLPPGLLSRAGWALLDDSTRPLLHAGWWRPRPDPRAFDWYFFGYGDDYRAALRALAAVAGPVPLPRRYALGSWYSRYWPYTSRELREIVEEYRRFGYPLDVMVLDMDWHRAGWTGWSWNRELLPDAEALLAWMHERGLAVTLNLHPADGVGPHEDAYPALMKALGEDPASGRTIPFNPWYRATTEALFREVHAPLERAGVDFWWLDWQQVISDLDPICAENLLLWMNRLYYQRSARDGRRGLSFSRWGGLGDHRHPIHFSGDCFTGFGMLAFAVPFTAVSGNAGLFFWSHDIGGHLGGRDEESFTRWVQFGALSPALRLHAMRAPDMDRRPWTYGPASQRSTRIAFGLRARLFPYLYGSAAQSCRETVPLVRPMYLDHAGEELAYQVPQQYLLGDDLLVAPVASAGDGPGRVAEQIVWFPPAATWYHALTGERFVGGQVRLVLSDLDEWPVFVRGGAPIPMQAAGERIAGNAATDIVVRVYPGPDDVTTTRSLYEDDGLSEGYTGGAFASTPLVYARRGDRVSLTIGPAQGGFPGMPDERAFSVELAGTRHASKVTVNGAAASFEYDAPGEVNRIRVPRGPVSRAIQIEADVDESDGLVEARRASARRAHGIEAPGAGAEDARLRLLLDGVAAVPTLGGVAGTGARTIWMCDEEGRLDGPLRFEIVDEWDGGEGAVLRIARREGECRPRPGAPVAVSEEGLPALDADARELDKRRVVIMETRAAGRSVVTERVVEIATALPVRRLRIAGPVPFDSGRDLAEQAEEARRAVRGAPVVAADAEGRLDLAAAFDAPVDVTDRVAVAAVSFYSAHNQEALLLLAADGPTEVWLDDARVHSAIAMRAPFTTRRAIALAVRHGTNRLAIKVASREGRWRLRARLKARRALVELAPELA